MLDSARLQRPLLRLTFASLLRWLIRVIMACMKRCPRLIQQEFITKPWRHDLLTLREISGNPRPKRTISHRNDAISQAATALRKLYAFPRYLCQVWAKSGNVHFSPLGLLVVAPNVGAGRRLMRFGVPGFQINDFCPKMSLDSMHEQWAAYSRGI